MKTNTTSLPRGFRAAAVEAAIKKPGRNDLALIVTDPPAEAVGVFTTNLFVAAPVVLCRETLAAGGKVRAIVVNAGNANAGTGERGMVDARETAKLIGAGLECVPSEVLVSSTGVIGRPLPMDRMSAGIAAVTKRIREESSLDEVSRAIMTTDKVPKVAARELDGATLVGIAKGAGMIHPNMATMLSFIMTDAAFTSDEMKPMLARAVERSFNSISVDNDMSTNDTVLLLANGLSGKKPAGFEKALEEVCRELALMIVRDGEGATKLVTITVSGAPDDRSAKTAAEAVATSMLVKTAIHGADPNWGRIVAAIGRSGVPLDPLEVRVTLQGLGIFERGLPAPVDLKALEARMKEPEIVIDASIGKGQGAWTVYTSDLSEEYVTENADYTT